MEYRQIRTSVYEEREKENMRATIAEQAAIIDYIAVMSDIELPTNEPNNTFESEQGAM